MTFTTFFLSFSFFFFFFFFFVPLESPSPFPPTTHTSYLPPRYHPTHFFFSLYSFVRCIYLSVDNSLQIKRLLLLLCSFVRISQTKCKSWSAKKTIVQLNEYIIVFLFIYFYFLSFKFFFSLPHLHSGKCFWSHCTSNKLKIVFYDF